MMRGNRLSAGWRLLRFGGGLAVIVAAFAALLLVCPAALAGLLR